QAQDGRLPRVGEVGQVRGEPVGGHRVLREVVRADGDEVQVGHDLVGHDDGRGDLDHRARGEATLAAQVDEPAGLAFAGKHRGHDPGGGVLAASLGGQRDGVELADHDALVVPGDAEAADAERRVV